MHGSDEASPDRPHPTSSASPLGTSNIRSRTTERQGSGEAVSPQSPSGLKPRGDPPAGRWRRTPSGALYSTSARIRTGPPEAPSMSMGRARIVAPTGGSSPRFVTFSRP